MDKDSVIEMLNSGPTRILFEKDDGSIREMNATLRIDLLPPQNENTKPRKESADVVKAYDLDKRSWRSFKIDRLRSASSVTV